MVIKLTSKRQATLPREVCEALGVEEGSRLELQPSEIPGEWRLRPLRVDHAKLAPLRGHLKGDAPVDMEKFRARKKDHGQLRN